MKRWLRIALATTACTGTGVTPLGVQGPQTGPPLPSIYSAEFRVWCDNCTVDYGREGSTPRGF